MTKSINPFFPTPSLPPPSPPPQTPVEILLAVHTFPYKLWLLDPDPPFE